MGQGGWLSGSVLQVHGFASTSLGRRRHIYPLGADRDVHEAGDSTIHERERETIVFERRDLNWIAVHEHLAPDPGKNAPAEK